MYITAHYRQISGLSVGNRKGIQSVKSASPTTPTILLGSCLTWTSYGKVGRLNETKSSSFVQELE